MTKSTLTICIATHNRSLLLDKMLDSIIIDLMELSEVSVLILDSASSDDTRLVCEKYMSICSRVNYMYRDSLGGIDKDYDICVRSADSEFCWLLCDDDVVVEGGLTAVVQMINGSRNDVYILNSMVCTYDLDTILLDRSLAIDKDVAIHNDSGYCDQLHELCGTYLCFTGALLFKRSKWMSIATERFYGTRFGDMLTISNFDSDSSVYILSEPIIKIRLGNAEWNNISFKIWYKMYPYNLRTFTPLTQAVIERLIPSSLIKKIKFFSWNRAATYFGSKEYVTYFQDFSVYDFLVATFVMMLPAFLWRFIYYCYFRITGNNLGVYNLFDGRRSKNSWLS